MKKPREFYVAVPKLINTVPVYVSKHYGSIVEQLRYHNLLGEFEIIKVKEITNEPRRPQKKAAARAKGAKPTRKVQAPAGKRKAKD